MQDALVKPADILEGVVVHCGCSTLKELHPPPACMWLMKTPYTFSCQVRPSPPFSSSPPRCVAYPYVFTILPAQRYMHLKIQALWFMELLTAACFRGQNQT